jgi:hypothetical protein
MKLVQTVLGLVAALGLLLSSAAVAGAAPARSDDFCGVSKNIAVNLGNLSNTLRSASSPTQLKAKWGAIISAEPKLKSSAPASLKGNLNTVLTLANNIDTDLKKANWSITGLLPYMGTLTVQLTKATPSINALKQYYRTTCKFDV